MHSTFLRLLPLQQRNFRSSSVLSCAPLTLTSTGSHVSSNMMCTSNAINFPAFVVSFSLCQHIAGLKTSTLAHKSYTFPFRSCCRTFSSSPPAPSSSSSSSIFSSLSPPKAPYSLLPGFLFCSSTAAVSFKLAPIIGTALSPLAVSFMLGALVSHTLRQRHHKQQQQQQQQKELVDKTNSVCEVRKMLQPGINVCQTLVLRTGIVSIGFKLSLLDAAKVGVYALPVIVACVVTGLKGVPLIARLLDRFFAGASSSSSSSSSSASASSPLLLSSSSLPLLLGVGTSICGVTAISACAPLLSADARTQSIAVMNIVVFGTAAMMLYPVVANNVFVCPEQVGLFLGLAIHDTSQVMGAALSYNQMYHDEVALQVATVTKLTRNLMLVFVIPYLSYIQNNLNSSLSSSSSTALSTSSMRVLISKYVPTFVILFLAATIVRSLGDYYILHHLSSFSSSSASSISAVPHLWSTFVNVIGSSLSQFCLCTAMCSIGFSIPSPSSLFNPPSSSSSSSSSPSSSKLHMLLPFLLGLLGATMVGSVAATGAWILYWIGAFNKIQ